MTAHAPLRRPATLAALLVTVAPAFAQGSAPAAAAPVDLKKWPKSQPVEAALLKDERALYKRLATDEERRQFIDFVYARRSAADADFRVVLEKLVSATASFKITAKDESTGRETTMIEGWESDPGRIFIGFGYADSVEAGKTAPNGLTITYKRELAPGLPNPFVVELRSTPQKFGLLSEREVFHPYSKLPRANLWEGVLAPAGPDWDSYRADPKSVQLRECLPLLPGLCAKGGASAAVEGGGAPAGDAAMKAGKIQDPDFSTAYPGAGSLDAALSQSYLPTQTPGVADMRVVLAVPGEAITGAAHLIPLEGSTGDEQEFNEADFKGLSLGGRYYLEARRAVRAGAYKLAALAKRGNDFARVAANVTVPTFTTGRLALAATIIADKAEKADPGSPFTFGDLRILPHVGKFKAAQSFNIFAVVNGAAGKPNYKLAGELTCHVEFDAAKGSKHKIDFGKSGVQEAVCASVKSNSPLVGFENIKVIPPPQPSVKIGNDTVPLSTKLFKVKFSVKDENGGQTAESGWIDVPLE